MKIVIEGPSGKINIIKKRFRGLGVTFSDYVESGSIDTLELLEENKALKAKLASLAEAPKAKRGRRKKEVTE